MTSTRHDLKTVTTSEKLVISEAFEEKKVRERSMKKLSCNCSNFISENVLDFRKQSGPAFNEFLIKQGMNLWWLVLMRV